MKAKEIEKKYFLDKCPIRKNLKIIWGKWAILILLTLKNWPKRFGEFKKIIPDISEKMLIQNLKILKENNFIKRKDFKTIPPKVEYSNLIKWNKTLWIVDIILELDK